MKNENGAIQNCICDFDKRNGEWSKENLWVPFSPSATKIFLKFEMLCHEWRHFTDKTSITRQDNKTSITHVMSKTNHCLIFAFRATNAILDPDQAQPSWCLWPQKRLLLKLSNNNEQLSCGPSVLQSTQVKHTPQDYIDEFIIRKLNLLVFVHFRFISAFLYVHWSVNSHIRQLLNFYQLIFLEFDVNVLEGILTFKDFQSDQIHRSSCQILTPHYAWRNAHLNLTLVTGTTTGFIFQMVASLTESWGYAWPALTGKFFNLGWFSVFFVS